MNDPPGVPSPLGIEVVEWFSEGGDNLTVRVTGRWRRRRPGWSAQPTLVIEAPGRRYRFPAMPEPPSLTGTPPGMWRISFTVPAALAPDLGGRAWLQFGAVVVPLPAAVEPMSAGEPTAEAARPQGQARADELGVEPVAEAPQPSPELEAETERRRAAEVEADADAGLSELSSRIQSLERELAETRDEAGRLSASLADQEQQRRTAEQRAHAERAQRLDVSRQLAERNREAERSRQALGDLAAAEERIRHLERELADARRRIDEAEQLAASAVSARERAERELASAASGVPDGETGPGDGDEPAERERLDVEQGLVARRESAGSRVPDEPASTPESAATPTQGVTPPAAAAPATEALIAALRAELTLRTGAEAALRSRLVESEARLAAREHLERRTGSTLSELRRELDGLRGAITRERAAREAAEQQVALLEADLELQRDRTSEASAAIGELRLALESLRAEAVPLAEPEPVAKPEPVAEPEPVVAPEPVAAEPEPMVAPEPSVFAEAKPAEAPEPEPVVAPEPEAPVEPEPVVAPEPEAPVEPEPVVAPEPEAIEPEAGEPEPQAEPEPPAEPQPTATAEPIASPAPAVPGAEAEHEHEPEAAPEPEPEPEPKAETVVPVVPGAPEPTPEEPSAPAGEPSAAAEAEAKAEAEAEPEGPEARADVEPERLSDALIRLRELIAPIEPAGEGESTPKPVTNLGDRAHPKWLRPGLVSLARSDPEQAGRALVAMMAAQGRVNREPIAYDLVLGGGHGCAHVTVYENQGTRVTFDESPRPEDDVAFRLIGGYSQLARRFTARWLRRQLHFGVARLKGKDAKRVSVVDALIDTDLGLSGLYHAGVRFAPNTSLMLLSRVIDPSWTEGVRFALAYGTQAGPSSYLVVGAEEGIQVADSAPDGRSLTTITGPPGSLEQVLGGAQGEDVVVAGEDWPLTSLRKWIKRAQSG